MSSSASGAADKGGHETIPDAPTATDPLLHQRSSTAVRDGDHVLLHFGDGRQVFAHCVLAKPRKVALRINRKAYLTHNLVGLPYGTVLEQQQQQQNLLTPLPPHDSKLIPDFALEAESVSAEAVPAEEQSAGDDAAAATTTTTDNETAAATDSDNNNDNNNTKKKKKTRKKRDNRSIVDNNTSQALGPADMDRLRAQGLTGADLVASLVEHSKTFDQKTAFSKHKYVVRKQMKHQPRCRIVRCRAATICEALFRKDPRKVMNLRQDTLAQILSYANLAAGCQALVLETCLGIVTGAVAQRLAGYGRIFSIYTGQQHSFTDMLNRFNLSFVENNCIKWVHAGDVFGRDVAKDDDDDDDDDQQDDTEQKERDVMEWPVELQPHTREYIERELMDSPRERRSFLLKRQARFARKLCRQTPLEAVRQLRSVKVDSIIFVAKYDPTETLLALWPYLKPSCPFVVYCEFMEPLTECFRALQQQELAINVRLSDTWMREYQVLKDRTRPNMNMSPHGGFILTGIKLDPQTGRSELDEEMVKEIKEKIGSRRRRERMAQRMNKTKNKKKGGDNKNESNGEGGDEARASKRQRMDDETT